MRANELFSAKTVFSFEIFPPKKENGLESVYKTLEGLRDLSPDFISVTCGAGGSGGALTAHLAAEIKNRYKKESAAHLPCMNLDKEEVTAILANLKENGIENILALRGDKTPDTVAKTDFVYASELISFIKSAGDFNIIAACYPEGHPESANTVEDIHNLKRKTDAGADQLIAQLCFDNDIFYSFLEKARIAGIGVPIQAGIMPVTNKKQIERIVSLCGATLPKKFRKIIDKYGGDPQSMRDAGIAYAIDQIVDLITCDVEGIHLYTMNNSLVAHRIYEAVSGLIKPR